MNSAHFLTPLTTQERKRTKIQPQKQSLCPLNAVSQRRVARSVKNYLHPHISDQIVSLHKALKKSVSQVSKHSLFQTLNMIFCAVMLLYYQSLEVFLFSCCCNQLPTAVSGVRGAILSPCPVFLCIMCCFNIVVHPIATFESNTLPSLFIRICSMMCASTR